MSKCCENMIRKFGFSFAREINEKSVAKRMLKIPLQNNIVDGICRSLGPTPA